MGCVGGGCVMSIATNPPPAICANGGPPIVVTTPTGSACTAGVASTTFTWALCSCTSVDVSGTLTTDAFNSTVGPYVPGAPGGGVGLDGNFGTCSAANIGGTLWASQASGQNIAGSSQVHQELHVGGNLTVTTMPVTDDAYVNGNVSGGLTVGKTLYAPMSATVAGSVHAAKVDQTMTSISVPEPCDCSSTAPMPAAAIGPIVANYKTTNDDAALGITATVLSGAGGPTRLDLPCGYYYFDSISPSVPTTVMAHGQVAIFVGGNIAPSDALTITEDPTSQLDVFVAGTVSSCSSLTLGSIQYPALFRMYVGTMNGLSLSSQTTIGGNLDAPGAAFGTSSAFDMYGALFVKSFNGSDNAQIHYDSAVVTVGTICPTTTTPTDGGIAPTGCKTCKDCQNQACVGGTCGSCTTNADCCAPLMCSKGKCIEVVQ
jgi:hypothetical protein